MIERPLKRSQETTHPANLSSEKDTLESKAAETGTVKVETTLAKWL
jgi:hypothetical protein